MIQLQVNSGAKSQKKFSADDLNNVLKAADKNKDGQVSKAELKSYNKKLGLLGLVSDDKELKELSNAAKFAEKNYALLDSLTNIGSKKDKGLDLGIMEMLAKFAELNGDKGDGKEGFIEVIKFFMSEMLDSLLGKDSKDDD